MTCDVTVVVPVYNGRELLARLLATVERQTMQPARVIVVDDGSSDGATDGLNAEVLSTGGNFGFARAVNTGIAASVTQWVAVINSDVELDPDWLRALLARAEATGAWFATGKIHSATNPGVLDGTWDLIARSACAWRMTDDAESGNERTVDMIPATAALFRRDLFQRIGVFDETLGSYLEDVDLGLRCMAAGIKGLYAPDAVCTHHGQGSTAKWSVRMVRLMSRNQMLLARKHFTGQRWLWPIFVGQVLWGLVALRHGRFIAWVKGKAEGFRTPVYPAPASPAFRANVLRSEQEIYQLSKNFYWRVYFWFTRVGSK